MSPKGTRVAFQAALPYAVVEGLPPFAKVGQVIVAVICEEFVRLQK